MGTKQKVSFVDRAKARSGEPSLKCGVCLFLSRLPDGYREEVLQAMQREDITSMSILDILKADDTNPPEPGSFKRHRSGHCQAAKRHELLGELDGVLRK
jgi:hypothetical protein